MDARLHGFRLGSTETCSLADLARYLQSIEPSAFNFLERERMLFAGVAEEFCVGVLLSLKDQRRFPEIEHGEDLKVFIHEAEEGRTPFDFNFFAFDPDTGGGVYQHYRGSCSIHRFGVFLGRLYDDLARNDCECDMETMQARESGRRLRSDQLDFSVVLRREGFEELIAGLNRATVFEYDVVTQEDMSDSFEPLQPFARLERRSLKFNAGTSGKQILSGVLGLLPAAAKNAMFRVVGQDDEGDTRRIDYDNEPPDDFAKDDVDSLADEVVLTFGDITKSTYVATMLKVLKENPALLGREDS